MKKQSEHLANFYIAGFTYYQGAQCMRHLKIGTRVKLKYEKGNPYDARAIEIYYKDYKLGYVPRVENRIFYKLLIMGYSGIFDAVIQQVDPTAHPEGQVRVVVHLLQNK
ncbi:DNA-binding protein [Ornithobacterium rhinotracheale]|uniref:HIRAN domain-containing protein n=1 Tax=Ornithobacterium rhinotracheale TaxID=28251 RepID=UPI00129C8A15|nr:HIRAN domain-containing protein [Ornithobacterium rhinotracheale]MRJ09231.1 DNA-binding protein [Ornithobacterium rhinotracheale]UOH78788.1 HIRAN domain-containing protein [Ornithobacterium rhinotracheale]